jgi:hypothetical protein
LSLDSTYRATGSCTRALRASSTAIQSNRWSSPLPSMPYEVRPARILAEPPEEPLGVHRNVHRPRSHALAKLQAG